MRALISCSQPPAETRETCLCQSDSYRAIILQHTLSRKIFKKKQAKLPEFLNTCCFLKNVAPARPRSRTKLKSGEAELWPRKETWPKKCAAAFHCWLGNGWRNGSARKIWMASFLRGFCSFRVFAVSAPQECGAFHRQFETSPRWSAAAGMLHDSCRNFQHFQFYFPSVRIPPATFVETQQVLARYAIAQAHSLLPTSCLKSSSFWK